VACRSTAASRPLIADRGDIAPIIQPMLAAWRQLWEQIVTFEKAAHTLVKADPTCCHLMSVPGIGRAVRACLLSAWWRIRPASAVRDPSAPTLGLTPKTIPVRRDGSWPAEISKCGDTLARTLMYEAAVVLMTRVENELAVALPVSQSDGLSVVWVRQRAASGRGRLMIEPINPSACR